MIVTIDGYAGSGKSTAAASLAAALGFHLLNTGAMYRTVGLILARRGVDIYSDTRDEQTIRQIVSDLRFDMEADSVVVNGEDVTKLLRTEELGRAASKVGTFPEVRTHLKAEQRRIAANQDIVCEGRDQGTAVFPDAPVKFFFRASTDVRAERRVAELIARGHPADFAEVRDQIITRDRQDESRSIDPLVRATDAIEIDSSNLSPEAVLQLMLETVARCRSRG